MLDYLLQYEDLKHIDKDDNQQQITDFIKNIPGKKLSELSLRDFVYYNGNPIYRGVGVYIFKSEERNYYVGSCIARSFIERIPAHLDIREVGWFNSLLKNIILNKEEYLKVLNDENFEKAASFAFEEISLIMINFNYEKGNYEEMRNRITNLERRIGKAINPFNKSFPKIKDVSRFEAQSPLEV